MITEPRFDAPVELTLTGEQQWLDGRAGEAVLRVVQEALTNVRKHAPGAEVSVSVTAGPERIEALIQDRQALPSGRRTEYPEVVRRRYGSARHA